MKVHYICTGNVYRSRLAEAYSKSLNIDGIEFYSSGVSASENSCGHISWYAQRIIQCQNLIPYARETWQETTKELLDSSDVNVFIRQDHYDKAKKTLNYTGDNYVVWDIPDLCDMQIKHPYESIEGAAERVGITEDIYGKITNNVDKFMKELK